jgi:hypothetical protein
MQIWQWIEHSSKLEPHNKKCTLPRLKPSSGATRHLLDHKTHLLDPKTHLAGGIAVGHGRFSRREKEIQKPRATRVKNLNSPLLMLRPCPQVRFMVKTGEGSGVRVA